MYARMDSVEIPRDHTNATAIQEMSFILQPSIVKPNFKNNSNSETYHDNLNTQNFSGNQPYPYWIHIAHLNKLKSSLKASSLTVKQVDAKISTNV